MEHISRGLVCVFFRCGILYWDRSTLPSSNVFWRTLPSSNVCWRNVIESSVFGSNVIMLRNDRGTHMLFKTKTTFKSLTYSKTAHCFHLRASLVPPRRHCSSPGLLAFVSRYFMCLLHSNIQYFNLHFSENSITS